MKKLPIQHEGLPEQFQLMLPHNLQAHPHKSLASFSTNLELWGAVSAKKKIASVVWGYALYATLVPFPVCVCTTYAWPKIPNSCWVKMLEIRTSYLSVPHSMLGSNGTLHTEICLKTRMEARHIGSSMKTRDVEFHQSKWWLSPMFLPYPGKVTCTLLYWWQCVNY